MKRFLSSIGYAIVSLTFLGFISIFINLIVKLTVYIFEYNYGILGLIMILFCVLVYMAYKDDNLHK